MARQPLAPLRSLLYLLGAGLLIITTQIKTSTKIDLSGQFIVPNDGVEARLLHTASTSRTRSRIYEPCPSTARLFDYYQDLDVAIQSATQFHLFGGNLRDIQAYKTKMVDDTTQAMKVVYAQEGKSYDGKTKRTSIVSAIREHAEKNRDARGGYGQGLAGEFKNIWTNNASLDFMHERRRVDIREPYDQSRFTVAMGPMAPNCSNLIMFGGGRREEQKWFCGEPATSTSKSSSACNVISIGSNDQWDMEKALLEKNCIAHTFDCTLPNHTPKNKPDSVNIVFYPHCLDATSHTDTATNRSYLSYADAFSMTGLTQAPTLLKMDIEGFEFDVLQSMVASSSNQLLPQQIMVELHWATRMHDVSWMLRTITSAEIALFSVTLFAGGGYLPVLRHGKSCKSCQEVLYVKTACPV